MPGAERHSVHHVESWTGEFWKWRAIVGVAVCLHCCEGNPAEGNTPSQG